jgi:conjugative transposon TraN protein
MKRLCAVWILFLSLNGHSQLSIPSYTLSVTFKKTTNVIFPYRIEKADIGSSDVIGHKDPTLENVLFLKAGRKDFTPTNLSVYTSDGKFYSFIVSYKEDPDTLNLSFITDQKSDMVVDSFMEARMDSAAVNILDQPSFLHRKIKEQEIKVILNGIYLDDDMLWFRIIIKNHSQIDYKPEFIRFSIRDKKTGKRTAVQESDVPFSWSNAVKRVSGNGKAVYLFALPSFTISKQKKLVFQIEEKKGERTIMLDIPSSTVLKARIIQKG